MGKIFIEHMGGLRVIICAKCETPITNRENLMSTDYVGSSGKAWLFSKATNLVTSEVQRRNMTTGDHFVRDVFCKVCSKKLGWMYELAVPKEQRHKEGKFILEKGFIKECR